MHSSTLALALTGASLVAQAPDAAATTRVDPEGAMREPIVSTWLAPRPVGEPLVAQTAVGNRFLSTDQLPEGDMPRDLAFTTDGAYALIVNRDTDTVTYLDVATRAIVASVPVGDFPVAIDVSPDGQWAVVANVLDDTISILSVAARAVVVTLPVTGAQPYAVHVTADSHFAVVGVINNAINSSLSVIDLVSLSEVRTIATGPQGVIGGFATPERGISGNLYTQFAVAPDSITVVVPDRPNARVALYDLTTGGQVALLPTPAGPMAVDIDPAGTKAVVTHEGATQALTVIDLTTRTLAGPPLALTQQLTGQVVRIAPPGTHAMAAIANNLIFIDLASGAITNTIATGIVGDIGVSFDGRYAVVSNNTTRVIDIPTRTVVAAMTVEPGVELAMSPVAHRAVVLDNRFYENALVFDTNGAASSWLGTVQSGPANEGDSTRALAISPDGRTIVASNIVSGNVAIVDAASETVRSYVTTGTRVWEAQITPDGAYAVVANTDSDSVTIIDLTTDTAVRTLSVPSRPTSIAISPDSTRAYVTTIAGTDRLATIALNGAASNVVGSVPTGQLGSILYSFGVSSGIALSPDGSLLAICASFDDQLELFRTATGTIVATLAVGDFPVQAAFSPDGSRLYVGNAFTDDISVIQVAGAASTVLATVPGTEFPLRLTVDATGAFVYVGCYDFATPRLAVLDTASLTVIANVPMPGQPYSQVYSATDATIYVSTTTGNLVRVHAAGAASAVVDTEPLTAAASDLVFSESLRRAYAAQMGPKDGIDVVAYGGTYAHYGTALPGTGGLAPRIEGTGVPALGANVGVTIDQGLPNTVGLLFAGLTQLSVPVFGGTLLVLPDLEFLHALSPTGTHTELFVVPTDNAFLGLDVYLQAGYLDAGAIAGVSHTDGLAMQIR